MRYLLSLLFILFIPNLYADIECADKSLNDACKSFKITSNEIQEICHDIIKKEHSLNIKWIDASQEQIQNFDINNDGINEKKIALYGGTLRNPMISYELKSGELILPEEKSNQRRELESEYILFAEINNNFFAYNVNIAPTHISIIAPDNKEYLLCNFESKVTKRLIPTSNWKNSKEICNAIENKDLEKVKYIEFNIAPKMTTNEFQKISELNNFMKKQAFVDYNNDGTSNKLIEILYSNSSIGLDFNQFDELSKSGKSFKQSESRKLLKVMQGLGISRPTTSYSNKFFKYDDKVYYEYNTRTKHQVSLIIDNNINVVCIEKVVTLTTVE